MSTTIYEARGAVAVITMNSPPVNGLGFDLRHGIVEGLARAEADANVRAVVLIGSARSDGRFGRDLLSGAIASAERVVSEKRPLKRVRDLKVSLANADAFFQFARNTVRAAAKNFPAPLKCVDAVAAAVAMPYEEGARLERESFLQLMQTPQSLPLRQRC